MSEFEQPPDSGDPMDDYQFHTEAAQAWINSARRHSGESDFVGAAACGAVAQAHATLALAAATEQLARFGISTYAS